MPERINGGLAAGSPTPPNKTENPSEPDGHYHYPGLAEEGSSGNTGESCTT